MEINIKDAVNYMKKIFQLWKLIINKIIYTLNYSCIKMCQYQLEYISTNRIMEKFEPKNRKKIKTFKRIQWITGNEIDIMGKNIINTLILKYNYCD